MQTQPGIRPLGGTGTPWVNDIEPRPAPDPLQYMMEKDRVRIARIRAPQHDQVSVLDLPIRAGAASRSEYRRQTGDAGRVSRPVTTVNVVTPHHHPGELLGHEIRLIARLRATKQPERLRSPGTRRLEPLRRPCERFVPGGRAQLPVLPDKWFSESHV